MMKFLIFSLICLLSAFGVTSEVSETLNHPLSAYESLREKCEPYREAAEEEIVEFIHRTAGVRRTSDRCIRGLMMSLRSLGHNKEIDQAIRLFQSCSANLPVMWVNGTNALNPPDDGADVKETRPIGICVDAEDYEKCYMASLYLSFI